MTRTTAVTSPATLLRGQSIESALKKVEQLKAQAAGWESKEPFAVGLAQAEDREEAGKLLLKVVGIKIDRKGELDRRHYEIGADADALDDSQVRYVRDAFEQFKKSAQNYALLWVSNAVRSHTTPTNDSEHGKYIFNKITVNVKVASNLSGWLMTRGDPGMYEAIAQQLGGRSD